MVKQPLTVLFAGYAPVHFICFLPLFNKLSDSPEVEVFVTGGLREKAENGYVYDTQAMYTPFNIDADKMLTVEEADKRHFNVVFSSSTSLVSTCTYDKSIQIFHGISFRNRSVRGENLSYDYYFMIGPYMRRNFSSGNLISENDPRGINIGFMKTDKLINSNWDKKALTQSFGFDGSRPILLYAPTGQKYNSLETIGEEVIKNICESDRFDLVIKVHDHPKNDLSEILGRVKALESKHCIITHEKDVAKCLYAADLLITDASSVSSEYALLNRPLVYLDVPKLIKKAKSKEGSMLDLNTWGRRAGKVITMPEEAVNIIQYSLDHPDEMSDTRQQMANDLFFNPGHATDVAFEWFSNNFIVKSAHNINT